jgi:hypothetical protein
MKRPMRFVSAWLLMLACAPAWAAWVLIEETSDKWLYIDPATIRKTGQLRRVWTLVNFKEKASMGAHSARTLQQYNCKEGRYRLLKHESYSEWMAGGRMVATLVDPEKWESIAPGTVAQAVFRKVCAK